MPLFRILVSTLVLCLAAVAQTAPRIVAADEILRDQVPSVRLEGLRPGGTYSLRTEWMSRAGTIWRSEAQFTADERGMVDVSTAAPVSGSYKEADPLGIMWSMERTTDRSSDGLTFDNDEYSALNLILRDGDKQVAQRYMMLRSRAIGVSTTELRGEVTGAFFSPSNVKGLHPGVIVLGGSEGGVTRPAAALLASHGFPTLALAYFGMGELPKDLERVPVETVGRGVQWLSKQPGVDPKRIVVLGMSKGAELALLAASRDPRIAGVIAIAPASVVYEGVSQGQTPLSSWTAGGRDVPFAPYVRNDEYTKSRRLIDLYNPSFDKAPPESAIEVEKIAGPIMLIAGKNDMLWPSARMADQIAARLAAKKFKYRVLNRQWPDTGHHVARIPLTPTADSVRLGGTARAIAHSQIEAWKEMVEFLGSLK